MEELSMEIEKDLLDLRELCGNLYDLIEMATVHDKSIVQAYALAGIVRDKLKKIHNDFNKLYDKITLTSLH